MNARIHIGDVRDVLASLPDESVHCVVTSPPYFGLRGYGVVGQIGLEPTLDAYIETMVGVFREVRRVLRLDGTLWLNMGDSYFRNPDKGGSGPNGKESAYLGDVYGRAQGANRGNGDDARAVACAEDTGRLDRVASGGKIPILERGRDAVCLKPKDLMMVPARLGLALQADGWWLRSEIVWAKKAPMPESVTDRPTSSHEKIFLLTKAERYYYDAEAVREKMAPESAARYAYAFGGNKSETLKAADATGMGDRRRPVGERVAPNGRNLRNVWHLGPEPFPEAHFATFPTEIPRRCILAGTSERGVCGECGSPWVRVVERGDLAGEAVIQSGARPHADEVRASASSLLRTNGRTFRERRDAGWKASCSCDAETVPAVVLDPFSGAGTTALVAGKLGRDFVGIELNPEYAAMSEARILREVGPLLVTVSIEL